MGWGEPHGRSAELVRQSELARRARAVVSAAEAFLANRSSLNEDLLRISIANYRRDN